MSQLQGQPSFHSWRVPGPSSHLPLPLLLTPLLSLLPAIVPTVSGLRELGCGTPAAVANPETRGRNESTVSSGLASVPSLGEAGPPTASDRPWWRWAAGPAPASCLLRALLGAGAAGHREAQAPLQMLSSCCAFACVSLGLAWRCDTSCLRSFSLCLVSLFLSCSFSLHPPLLLSLPFSPLPNSLLQTGSCIRGPALLWLVGRWSGFSAPCLHQ